ncbi:TIGR01440 family protein [Bacillus sp. V3B]|uniref:TIGR01440 family protein n=1 Tax=Bacillus sp. V3B TaxID=2804915 RepID=UPI00210B8BFE|nr:TIGR01440 family protein [Bacillus sp. V3B]MCQ6274608.1 TIGR01440 family protein [Bacillus sp. V3B]
MNTNTIKEQTAQILTEFGQQAGLGKQHVLVIGCSTSEVCGGKIGTSGTSEVAEVLFTELQKFHKDYGVALAFQCCEHLNRALVVERETAEKYFLEIVSVVPVRKAGGAMATYAFEHMVDPVVVEFIKADAGIDIGDTLIGMHLKHVAVPIRTSTHSIGKAHVTMAKVRSKLIGGERAVYEVTKFNQSCY